MNPDTVTLDHLKQQVLPELFRTPSKLGEYGPVANSREGIKQLEKGVWGATEQKVHLSPAPARKPLWRLVSSGKPRFCRTLSRNGSVR